MPSCRTLGAVYIVYVTVRVNWQFHQCFSNDSFPRRFPAERSAGKIFSLPADASRTSRKTQAFGRKRLYAAERAIFGLGKEIFPVFSRTAGKTWADGASLAADGCRLALPRRHRIRHRVCSTRELCVSFSHTPDGIRAFTHAEIRDLPELA